MNNRVAMTLWAVAGVLLVLWIIGLVAQATFGGALHLLLILVVVAVVLGVFRSRRDQNVIPGRK